MPRRSSTRKTPVEVVQAVYSYEATGTTSQPEPEEAIAREPPPTEESESACAEPRRQLKVEDALAYLDQVRDAFAMQPRIYYSLIDLIRDFKAQSIDTPRVINRIITLFQGRRELILGFNTFLPPGFKIRLAEGENTLRVHLEYPDGMTGPQPTAPLANAPPSRAPRHSPPPGPSTKSQSPIEFDQAINYVTKVKQRFAKQPGPYRAFLEILHTYQKEQKTIKEVYQEVAQLFRGHPDLLLEFHDFLPDGTPWKPLQARMEQWRRKARLIGHFMVLWRRATERAYAPGGLGYETCRDEFAGLAGLVGAPSPSLMTLAEGGSGGGAVRARDTQGRAAGQGRQV